MVRVEGKVVEDRRTCGGHSSIQSINVTFSKTPASPETRIEGGEAINLYKTIQLQIKINNVIIVRFQEEESFKRRFSKHQKIDLVLVLISAVSYLLPHHI